jgi:alanine racemase
MKEAYLTWAEIDLDAIDYNVRQLKRMLGPAVLLTAVVKGEAYGHGAVSVSRCALAAGADRLAVASPREALNLRRAGVDGPVLILGPTPPWEAERLVAQRVMATVMAWPTAQALSGAAVAAGVTATVHIKVDTGMGRYGLLPDEVLPFALALRDLPGLQVEGLWTHFATAEDLDDSYLHQQLGAFLLVAAQLRESGISVPLRHAASTGAAICHPESRLDMVRCGLSVYGLYPSARCRDGVDLHPAMSLKSRVSRLRWLPEGSTIGYGRTYRTTRHTLVAFVPIGYADGLRRALSNRGRMLVRGQRVPLIGRICMDGCMADVTAVEGVQEGDEAVLLGCQGQAEITADEIAESLGTISYEIVTTVGPRVPRVYLHGGKAAS